MPSPHQQIAERLKAFKERGDLEALSGASDLIESLTAAVAASPTEKHALRAEALRLRLAVLHQVDTRIERDFNFDDMPSLSISPPPETGLPSGVDPASITDPEARARYEKEIAANQQKAARYAFQKKLHRFDRQATSRAGAFIVSAYSASPEDIAELKKLLEESPISGPRKAALRQQIASLRKP